MSRRSSLTSSRTAPHAGPDRTVPERSQVERFLYDRVAAALDRAGGRRVASTKLPGSRGTWRSVSMRSSTAKIFSWRVPQPPDRRADRPRPRRPDLAGRGAPRQPKHPARNAPARTGARTPLYRRGHNPHRPRWILPHPERTNPQLAPMVRDEEIERIAIAVAIEHEQARGWIVEDVESQNRGFDLISRRPHPEDPEDVRRSPVHRGERAGWRRCDRGQRERVPGGGAVQETDFWLYVAFNCGTKPELHTVQNPIRLGWQPVMAVEHYQISPRAITGAPT